MVVCAEIVRYFTALCRGRDKYHEFIDDVQAFPRSEDLTEDCKVKHPKFCWDCMDHGLLQLRVEAVRRARKRRAEFDDNASANQRPCFGSSSS